jgi:hypothetical protein
MYKTIITLCVILLCGCSHLLPNEDTLSNRATPHDQTIQSNGHTVQLPEADKLDFRVELDRIDKQYNKFKSHYLISGGGIAIHVVTYMLPDRTYIFKIEGDFVTGSVTDMNTVSH